MFSLSSMNMQKQVGLSALLGFSFSTFDFFFYIRVVVLQPEGENNQENQF